MPPKRKATAAADSEPPATRRRTRSSNNPPAPPPKPVAPATKRRGRPPKNASRATAGRSAPAAPLASQGSGKVAAQVKAEPESEEELGEPSAGVTRRTRNTTNIDNAAEEPPVRRVTRTYGRVARRPLHGEDAAPESPKPARVTRQTRSSSKSLRPQAEDIGHEGDEIPTRQIKSQRTRARETVAVPDNEDEAQAAKTAQPPPQIRTRRTRAASRAASSVASEVDGQGAEGSTVQALPRGRGRRTRAAAKTRAPSIEPVPEEEEEQPDAAQLSEDELLLTPSKTLKTEDQGGNVTQVSTRTPPVASSSRMLLESVEIENTSKSASLRKSASTTSIFPTLPALPRPLSLSLSFQSLTSRNGKAKQESEEPDGVHAGSEDDDPLEPVKPRVASSPTGSAPPMTPVMLHHQEGVVNPFANSGPRTPPEIPQAKTITRPLMTPPNSAGGPSKRTRDARRLREQRESSPSPSRPQPSPSRSPFEPPPRPKYSPDRPFPMSASRIVQVSPSRSAQASSSRLTQVSPSRSAPVSPIRLSRPLPGRLNACLAAQKRAVMKALRNPPDVKMLPVEGTEENEDEDEASTNVIAYEQLSALIEGTVERGEGNSCFLIGPRGSGKTHLVEKIIDKLPEQPIVIRLSGHVQTSDRLAMREIARQLSQQTGGSFLPESESDVEEDVQEDPLHDIDPNINVALPPPSHLPSLIAALPTLGRPTIVVLDGIDLFALHPRQSLLYCLLDTAQSNLGGKETKGLAVVGVTTRVDTVNLLEKRVKSRFSGRMIRTAGLGQSGVDDWAEAVRTVLGVEINEDVGEEEKEEWRSMWLDAIGRYLQDKAVVNALKETLSLTRDIRMLCRIMTGIMMDIEPSSPFPVPAKITSVIAAQRCPPQFPHLSSLPYPAVCLLIASIHAQTSGHDAFTFEMLHESFRDQVRTSQSAPVQIEGGSIGMMKCSREMLMGAFENLVQMRLFVPVGPATTNAGKEFVKHRCVLERDEVKRTVEKIGQTSLKKWFSKAQ